MEVRPEDERPNVHMTGEDKDKINRFSRLLARKSDISVALERREKLMQLHEDAADELMLLDEDAEVQYNVGDVFFYDDKSEIEARIEETKQELASEVTNIRAEFEEALEEIKTLKATLYAKFGKTINLEETSDE